jgi:hypothetical protein
VKPAPDLEHEAAAGAACKRGRPERGSGFYVQEVALKAPRFRIAWVMVAVAIAALDFGAIRALIEFNSRARELLLLGALPMANVLAIGMLIRQQSPGIRLFLLGFEVFGAMALALYVALSFLHDNELISNYLAVLLEPIQKIIGQGRPFVFIPIACFVAVVMLGWPQVAFALMGGFLFRRFRVTITRR